MATGFKFSDLRFQRDSKGDPVHGPQHGVSLLESLPAVDGQWMTVLPTQSQLRDAHRVFPRVVGAYELALFHVCMILQENEQLRNEVAALRQCQEADAV
jgi:hypothetical protein